MSSARDRAITLVRAESSIPPVAREMIVQQLQRMNSTMNSRGQGSTQQMDLAAMADKMPGSAAIKPQLSRLNDQIGAEIKAAMVNSFTTTWLLGGLILLLGLIPGAFARHRQPADLEAKVIAGAV